MEETEVLCLGVGTGNVCRGTGDSGRGSGLKDGPAIRKGDDGTGAGRDEGRRSPDSRGTGVPCAEGGCGGTKNTEEVLGALSITVVCRSSRPKPWA